jgi:ssDNA thymidine ADP-ribosyltransferase, DarT
MTVPAQPKLYHITHVENLPAILAAGGLWSDAAMIAQGGPSATIGMGNIKQRRLALPVKCHPGDHVGDYVPFYFCAHSIMLYLIYCANHPDMTYRGGQAPILHLEANLYEVVQWGEQQRRRWAFTLSNAGANYTEFRKDLKQLDDVDWAAVAAPDFRDAQVKESKQAEFLLHEFFPWHLVRRIGVFDATVYNKVVNAAQNATHRPTVEVRREWYF